MLQKSSRLSLWENNMQRERPTNRGGGGEVFEFDARLLNLQIIDATFQTDQADFSAFIEIRNITTGQVEKTKTVEAAAPHYDDQFIFKTKQVGTKFDRTVLPSNPTNRMPTV